MQNISKDILTKIKEESINVLKFVCPAPLYLLFKMNMYYFGQSLQYIEAEYATSNRSSCRGCKEKINKEQLRLGLILDDDHFNAKYWYHLQCFQLKPRHKQIDPDHIAEKIYNIDRLQQQDYDAVVAHIKQELERLKNGKKPKAKAKNQKETKKTSKKQSKKSKKEQASSSQSQSSSSSESEQKNSKNQKGQKKKRKLQKKSVFKRYNYPHQAEFEKYSTEYSKMNANQLKDLLAKNNQSKNATKDQLVQKCADGKVLGQIPKCSSCGGGRLRFDRQTGVYTCPGFMEDTDFIRCNKKFLFQEVKRTDWIE